jgi:para-nitrobenzyl esterase
MQGGASRAGSASTEGGAVLRKILVVLVAIAVLAGVGLWVARRSLVAATAAPPDVPHTAAADAVRTLPGGGEVQGFVGRYGSHVWLGLPYAKPPTGARRWRAPEPPDPWSGRRPALAFGPHCPQLATPLGGVHGLPPGTLTGDEDCLYLNVYAPRMEGADAAQRRLPVMMWIHGGGNVVGLADDYDGGRLAALGPFGWFRHASLRAGASPAEQSGNFGTLDLIRALGWVHENVAAFGGDPDNVTIFGESAGGTNVFTLLLSPLASGLFQRAIVESGGTSFTPVAQAEHFADDAEPGHRRSSNEVLLNLLVADGKAPDRLTARTVLEAMAPAEVAAYLRQQPPARLFAAYQPDPDEGLLDMPRVFADGTVLPMQDPATLFARADGWNRVPVMLGTNRDENKLFLFVNPNYVQRWLGVVPRIEDPPLFLATAEAEAALWKATGADGPATAMCRSEPRVFVYRFDWDEEPTLLGLDLARYLGAAHGFEIPFVFGHWDLGPQGNVIFDAANRAGREALAGEMMSYWTEFATTGDPGTGRSNELPAWTAWDDAPGGHKTMDLDTPTGGGLRMGSEPVTVAGVLASVRTDPRLATERDRCWVYHELVRWSRALSEADYARAGGVTCAAYPFGGFPWR